MTTPITEAADAAPSADGGFLVPDGDWRDPDALCVQCGEPRAGIRRERLICGLVNHYGELEHAFSRHRFKPWSPAELEAQARAERAICDDMGAMAAWWEKEGKYVDDVDQ